MDSITRTGDKSLGISRAQGMGTLHTHQGPWMTAYTIKWLAFTLRCHFYTCFSPCFHWNLLPLSEKHAGQTYGLILQMRTENWRKETNGLKCHTEEVPDETVTFSLFLAVGEY
jgi:hypothetical protein